ncbi:multidrug efflux system outer membrane protein [Pseudomonas citronellolis]|uniref:efflux transporter outer membrane subunit n=1 Tax=Pseudomonas citronellolis TaxID=53408 RepID=UPI00209C98C5|nr:efflux transporter outer membrane subunit [Pseudomonas citronellolis]MCP1640642.1 multidrug efflux system outer membrane protein [Pseudomonas citronellolis]MCP1663562.1 multidrug efflux system outer membrane protein [Pseudomonas citronellolis]MCP1696136.1 multidrug efflux system outer membrane protein [Pseudomonas citronellolis]MCP1701627.1 multidrug efflux system outer membrane protein [Pseudomonas citronellolis]MCP1795348.1 multidrug efflux system outer membrane protein [Pseudomonas citro
MRTSPLPLLLALLLGGCVNLAPDYQRPAAPVAAQWPGAAPAGASQADVDWREFFVDARLRDTVARALANNRDLRVAALNVEYQRAQYRIQRAELFPAVSASAEGTRQRALSDGTTAVSSQYSVGLGVSSYELDLFGRLRNLKDAALEDYLALEQTRRSTQISLVAEVASAWMTLAADQQLLKLASDTHASQQKTYELVQRSHGLGGESGLSLAQARSTVESARAEAASYASQVEQDRNALELLVGERLDASLLPGDTGLDAALLVTVPAGLPSSLLQRRPDVLAAEHTLKAANADIGAARAAFFPSVSLTASGGSASGELSGLFKSGSRAWSFAPSINLPIFDAGSNQAGLDAAKITRDIDVANYEKALQTAFSEVADALSVRSHINERLDAQRELTAATDKSYDLSLALYKQGSDSFLEVLDAQRSLYSAQQTLISLELAEQVNRVTLYKVLGGGWQG